MYYERLEELRKTNNKIKFERVDMAKDLESILIKIKTKVIVCSEVNTLLRYYVFG